VSKKKKNPTLRMEFHPDGSVTMETDPPISGPKVVAAMHGDTATTAGMTEQEIAQHMWFGHIGRALYDYLTPDHPEEEDHV